MAETGQSSSPGASSIRSPATLARFLIFAHAFVACQPGFAYGSMSTEADKPIVQ
jgi:hypothetical protein